MHTGRAGAAPTLARASTSAPFRSRQRTTSTWPARAAMCSAVSPRCGKQERSSSVAKDNTCLSEKFSDKPTSVGSLRGLVIPL